MKKRIHVVINPASGVEVPVLYYINKLLPKSKFDWTVSVTQKEGDARRQVGKAALENVDLIAVYGGDGTIMEAAQALFKSTIPLAIIPGGTANVMARELQIPIDIPAAITLIAEGNYVSRQIDMALLNNQRPFLIRINVGILADMVKNTDRDMKNRLGKIAYGVGVAKDILSPTKHSYVLTIDDKKIKATGISLVIANSGNIGITGYSLVPNISVNDGMLDVVLFRKASVNAITEWVGSQITNSKPDSTIKHWKAKEVTIAVSPLPSIICDDEEIVVKEMNIKIVPDSLQVITPSQ